MNIPNPALAGDTDALRGDLRPCATLPRPIPYPPTHQLEPIAGTR